MDGIKGCAFMYYVSAIDNNGFESPKSDPTSVDGEYVGPTNKQIEYEDIIATDFKNFPNPFNPTTRISFNLDTRARVELTIYDSNGKQIETIVNKQMNSGYHAIQFNGKSLASGLYLVELKARSDNGKLTRKNLIMNLIK